MRVEFHPSWTDSWAKIPGQDVGLLVCLPDSYDDKDNWPCMKFVHGMNQGVGGGTLASLKTILEGPYQVIPNDWKEAVDKYGIVGILVSYNTFFQPESHDFVYKFVKSKYNVVDRWMEQGFSWGDGSLRKYYRSSLERAQRIACTVEVSGTVEGDVSPPATWENIAKAKVSVWAGVHKADAKVGSAPTLKAINGINSFNPPVKAVYSMWDGVGHGPTNTMLGLTPFTITDGEGLVNPAENVYEWYKDILANGPRQPKSIGGTTVPTIPTTPTQPVIDAIPDLTYKVEGDIVTLDASASTGIVTGQWDSYSFGFAPDYGSPNAGTWSWANVSPYSSTPIKIMNKVAKGDYLVTLTVKSKAGYVKKEFKITVLGTEPPLPKPIDYNWLSKSILFDNDTRVAVTATFKTSTGKEYTN